MEQTNLSHAVDTWTAQAAVASRYLLRLYRLLGDDKQAANAIQAGKSAEERADRQGLKPLVASMLTIFSEENQDLTLGEARAWETLIEAHAGISAFHAMVEGHGEHARRLQGLRNATTKALDRSMHGYRVAFPEEMANEGIRGAVDRAATICAQMFIDDMPESEIEEDIEAVRVNIYQEVLNALSAQTRQIRVA